jgi:preprotein translocase subunit SecF
VTQVGASTIRVETETLNTETEVPKVKQALADLAGISPDQVNYSLIGASWGSQITERGLIALGVFLLLVSLMLWAYMRNLKMAGAAMVALLHDLVITIGVYALVGFTFTPESLIGMLTILGYSLYDTVVVFDKVRENTRHLTANSSRTYSEAANLAVNQTLVRSINTTIIGVLPVAALLFAGGVILHTGPLKDLSLALFVGMVSGAYSSLFIATPLLAMWKEREPDMIRQAKRVALRREREEAKAKGIEPTRPARKSAAKSAAGGAGRTTLSKDAEDEIEEHGESAEDEGRLRSGDELTGTVGRSRITVSVRGDDAGGTDVGRSGRSAADSAADARRDRLSDGAAKRPQPERKARSKRKK